MLSKFSDLLLQRHPFHTRTLLDIYGTVGYGDFDSLPNVGSKWFRRKDKLKKDMKFLTLPLGPHLTYFG